MARIGGVLSNTVGKLAEYHVAIPTTMFGVSALLSALFSLMLPETAGQRLPDTIEECERTRESAHIGIQCGKNGPNVRFEFRNRIFKL